MSNPLVRHPLRFTATQSYATALNSSTDLKPYGKAYCRGVGLVSAGRASLHIRASAHVDSEGLYLEVANNTFIRAGDTNGFKSTK